MFLLRFFGMLTLWTYDKYKASGIMHSWFIPYSVIVVCRGCWDLGVSSLGSVERRLRFTFNNELSLSQMQESPASKYWSAFPMPRAFYFSQYLHFSKLITICSEKLQWGFQKYNAICKFSIHQVPQFSLFPEPIKGMSWYTQFAHLSCM